MPFTDRTDAGRKLADALAGYKDAHPVVLALPRGGVLVAAEVAKALDAPLDLVLVRKIGVPMQPELAMGAAVDGPHPTIVRNEDVIQLVGIEETEFETVCRRELEEIERRRRTYLGTRPQVEVSGRVAILIDDGIATGATTRAALRATRLRRPRELVLAAPVAPTSTVADLQGEADKIVCLEQQEDFSALGFFYADFRQVSDEQVIDMLSRFPIDTSGSANQPAA